MVVTRVRRAGLLAAVLVLSLGTALAAPLALHAESARHAKLGDASPDTIPITISHGKLHVRGSVNGSRPLDLIFDTGADVCVLYPSAMKKGAALKIDDTATNRGTGGVTERGWSRDNHLEVAGLRWDHEPLLYVERQADHADGIIGWPVFQFRVVEFDFVRGIMVVCDSFPAPPGFRATPLRPAGTLTAVDLELLGGEHSTIGPFVLDTAGNGTLIVHAAFADSQGVRAGLRKIGTSVSHGVGGAAVHNDILKLPVLSLAGIEMHDVPIDVERAGAPESPTQVGVVCMDVLGRFDMVLDYPSGRAWFRPNARLGDRFPRRGSGSSAASMIAIWAAIAVALGFGSRRRRGPVRPGPEAEAR